MVSLRLKTIGEDLSLISLPWETPLDAWPEDLLIGLPAGFHRHIVRFVKVDDATLAIKELPERLAVREFELLERLREENLPAVTLVGIATDRFDADGNPLEAALVTRHLRYSLPYRFLFTEARLEPLRPRVVDALVVLLVRLHLVGFFWGDCSLNNALFRRDAGALRAYVVDTETGEWHGELSDGQRTLELDIAVENVLGGLYDLQAEGLVTGDFEPEAIVDHLVERYGELWSELNDVDEVPASDLGRIHRRLSRLNDLGFDTEEYELNKADGMVRFRPTIVEEGHHRRRLERMTGIQAHENQARRLLAALNGYGAWLAQTEGEIQPVALVAYRWLKERWEPTLAGIPADVRGRLEDAEIYHEILEHSWYLSEHEGHDVPLDEATEDYVRTVLRKTPDERTVLTE